MSGPVSHGWPEHQVEDDEAGLHDRRPEVSEGEGDVAQGGVSRKDRRESRQVVGVREFAQSRRQGGFAIQFSYLDVLICFPTNTFFIQRIKNALFSINVYIFIHIVGILFTLANLIS